MEFARQGLGLKPGPASVASRVGFDSTTKFLTAISGSLVLKCEGERYL